MCKLQHIFTTQEDNMIKRTLSAFLAALMLICALTAVSATAAEGTKTVYFHPGVASVDNPVWFAWTWSEGEEGHWVNGGKNAETIVFNKLCDNVVFVRMPNGSTQPDWDAALNQSEDLKVENVSFTVTRWADSENNQGKRNFTGEWSSKKPVSKSKSPNPIKLTVSEKRLAASALKKSQKTVKPVKISSAKGKVTIKKVKKGTSASIYKKIKVNSATGAVTFKKGSYAKKTYKIKLRIKAAGDSSYSAKTITKTVRVMITTKAKAKKKTMAVTEKPASETKKTACAYCNGTGRAFCTACGGRGGSCVTIDETTGQTVYLPCTVCHGTLYTTCPYCKGTGYLETK